PLGFAVDPGPDCADRAGALEPEPQGSRDPPAPLRDRRRGRAHAGGGRPALRRDPGADPPDRGEGAPEAALPAEGSRSAELRRELTRGAGLAPGIGTAGPPSEARPSPFQAGILRPGARRASS